MNDSVVRSRIDPVVKEEASKIFRNMGLSMSEGIRIFLHQVTAKKAIPFPIEIPNQKTIKAMKAVNAGQGLEPVTLDLLKDEWDEACEK